MIPGSEVFASRPVKPEDLRQMLPSKLKVHSVTQEQIDALDPLTYEVVRHRLWSVTDEMGEALKRMSGSPIVTDANDFDFTINDEMGQLVQVGLYNTMLVGAIDLALQWTLRNRADNPGICEGDMFLCNDPWVGGGLHQSDVLVFQPIFLPTGELFGWTSAICHEPDLGGAAPGSHPIGNVDVFSESLPTPPVKIVRGGEIQRDVLDMWVRRSRVPMVVSLDLRAKVGANNIGRAGLMAVIDQYGPDIVKAVMKRMMDDAEHRMREKLKATPDGRWSATGYTDQAYEGDRASHKTVLTMTKQGGHLTFDFRGTDPQAGVINCTYGGCRGGIMLAFLPLLAGDIPWSASGLMRCFDIITDEGTLQNAQFPAAINRAPLGSAWLVGNLVAQCLAQMLDQSFEMRGNVQASCCGTYNFAAIAGVDERSEQPMPFLDVVMEMGAGGYGAAPHRDGISTGGVFCIPMGRAPDAEITELLYPLLVLWRREEKDSGGPGRQRGGASMAVALTPHGTSLPAHVVLSSSGKANAQNPGLAGGYPGNLGYDVIVRNAGVREQFAAGAMPGDLHELSGDAEVTQCYAHEMIDAGDVVYLNCQGGGGYGDPLLRDPALVATDVAGGLVSAISAHDVYGVVTDGEGAVDAAATEARREAIRADRRAQAHIHGSARGKVDLDRARPLDDNLAIVDGNELACRHCGERLGPPDGLHIALVKGEPALAGPGVRADAEQFVEGDIAFHQTLCPSCMTAIHTAISPADDQHRICGFAMAE